MKIPAPNAGPAEDVRDDASDTPLPVLPTEEIVDFVTEEADAPKASDKSYNASDAVYRLF